MKCHSCGKREGDLVAQFRESERRDADTPPIFRLWLCRWCRGAANRKRAKWGGSILRVIEWLPDEEVEE